MATTATNETSQKHMKTSNDKKMKIVEDLKKGLSVRKAATKHNVSKGVVQNVKKQKLELIAHLNDDEERAKYRLRPAKPLNKLVYRWFLKYRDQGLPITGPIIKLTALKLHETLNDPAPFKASEGWLEHWKKSYNIRTRVVSGESAVVDNTVVKKWVDDLPKTCEGYRNEDIFNMDETGFFFRALPTRTLATKTDLCKGGKLAKDRVTVALACSIMGEKLKPIVIGKAKRPQCF